MTAQFKKANKGFTLIELLVVIGILAILLAITLIAINPARQFGNANDTQRSSDVNAILNAIGQYAADNSGNLPDGAGTPPVELDTCTSAAPCTISNDSSVTPRIDLCNVLTTDYIAALPVDPTAGTGDPVADPCTATYNTGYQVSVSAADNRVTVTSPDTNTYQTGAITATR